MLLVHVLSGKARVNPSLWLATISLSPLMLDPAKLNTIPHRFFFFFFYGHVSSYSSFHLLFSWVWPLKRSQAQRLWSPYGPRIERLVLWKKVFNCSWHFRVRHWGNHLADSRHGLWCWQQTPQGPRDQVGQVYGPVTHVLPSRTKQQVKQPQRSPFIFLHERKTFPSE